jgi:hypothetical protein
MQMTSGLASRMVRIHETRSNNTDPMPFHWARILRDRLLRRVGMELRLYALADIDRPSNPFPHPQFVVLQASPTTQDPRLLKPSVIGAVKTDFSDDTLTDASSQASGSSY